MKKIAVSCSVAALVLMSTSVFADLVEPPPPASPVLKVDPEKVTVFANNPRSSGTAPVISMIDNTEATPLERLAMRPSGITTWTLGASSNEAGKVMLSTPGGGLGLVMWPGMATDWSTQNSPRFDFATWPKCLSTTPPTCYFSTATTHIGFNGPNLGLGIGVTQENKRITQSGEVNEGNYVGINTLAPNARLEVKDGGIRINNQSTTARPVCGPSTRGTFWVTIDDASSNPPADSVSVCLAKKLGNGTEEYKWRTIVASGNSGEHVSGNTNHTESD
jgi:hypothetical protein